MITISKKVADKLILAGAILIQAKNNEFYLIYQGVELFIYDYDYPEQFRDTY